MKKKILIVVLVCSAFAVYWLWGGHEEKEVFQLENNQGEVMESSGQDTISEPAIEGKAEKKEKIFVDVCGAVKRPSVVQLPEGSRAFEAIEAAGGVSSEGDTTPINLASELSDGQQLYVPLRMDVQKSINGISGTANDTISAMNPLSNSISDVGAKKSAAVDSSMNGKININSAGSDELQQIKGIGPKMAERILEYRKTNGSFKEIEDLRKVKGIGAKTLEKMRNSICV